MPLTFQDLFIPATTGLDESTDRIQSKGHSRLENVVWNKEGLISKRNGYARIGNEQTLILSGWDDYSTFAQENAVNASNGTKRTEWFVSHSAINSYIPEESYASGAFRDVIKTLAVRSPRDDDEELLLFGSSSIWRYSSNIEGMVEIDDARQCRIGTSVIKAGNQRVIGASTAVAGNIRVTAWNQWVDKGIALLDRDAYQLMYCVEDVNTGNLIIKPSKLENNAHSTGFSGQPKVIEYLGKIFIFWVSRQNGDDVTWRIIDPATPWLLSAIHSLTADAASIPTTTGYVADVDDFDAVKWTKTYGINLGEYILISFISGSDDAGLALGFGPRLWLATISGSSHDVNVLQYTDDTNVKSPRFILGMSNAEYPSVMAVVGDYYDVGTPATASLMYYQYDRNASDGYPLNVTDIDSRVLRMDISGNYVVGGVGFAVTGTNEWGGVGTTEYYLNYLSSVHPASRSILYDQHIDAANEQHVFSYVKKLRFGNLSDADAFSPITASIVAYNTQIASAPFMMPVRALDGSTSEIKMANFVYYDGDQSCNMVVELPDVGGSSSLNGTSNADGTPSFKVWSSYHRDKALPPATWVDLDAPNLYSSDVYHQARLPEVVFASGTYQLALPVIGTDGTGKMKRNLSMVEFSNTHDVEVPTVKWDDAVIYGGGKLRYYDGITTTELGFDATPKLNDWPPIQSSSAPGGFTFPEWWPTFITGSMGSNRLAAGSYNYYSTYSWTDAFGREHRSGPGVAASLVVTASCGVQVNVPTLVSTDKEGVRIDVWRTEANGLIAYLIASGTQAIFNNKDVPYVSIIDEASDADLADNEPLYTVGSVNTPAELPSDPPPNSSIISVWDNRLWLVNDDDRNDIWFSKPNDRTRLGPEFSGIQRIKCDPSGGDIIALAPLDDKFIIFKENTIFAIVGQGPDRLGNGTTYSVSNVTSEVGCVQAKSIVVAPIGLMFISRRGIYVLGRDLTLIDAGAPVRDLVLGQRTCVRATNDGQNERIIFSFDDGSQAVFNTRYARWTTWNLRDCFVGDEDNLAVDVSTLATGTIVSIGDQAIYDAAIYNGNHVLATDGAWTQNQVISISGSNAWQETARSQMMLMQYTSGTWNDANENGTQGVLVRISTPWLNVAGVSGQQRTQRVTPNMELRGSGSTTITTTVEFDGGSSLVQAAETFVKSSSDITTGTFDMVEPQVHLRNQRSSNIRATYELDGSDEGLAYRGTTLRIGIKGRKYISSQRDGE